MVEDGGGEAEGVDAVEDSAVAFDECAGSDESSVAFDGGHGECSGGGHDGDGERHGPGLPPMGEGRCPVEREADDGGGKCAGEEAFPGASGVDRFGDEVLAEESVAEELEEFGDEDDRDEEEEEAGVGVVAFAMFAGKVEQRGGEAEAVDADE